MRRRLPPFGPNISLGLDLGVDHREINAGVTTSHLKQAVAEQIIRSAGAVKKADPTKVASAPASVGVKTMPESK